MKYAIIVIAYNREKSLQRLLCSLEKAEYYGDNITLIISIDKSDNPLVEEYANIFTWKHGLKIVNVQKNNLGLKNHILKCGNYLNEYELDAAAILEDDILVSEGFYNYMRQSVPFYKNCTQIAGISLYTHLWYIPCERPFIPQPSTYDTYFMKYAQSWGQIWLRKPWNEFYNWYLKQNGKFDPDPQIPSNLWSWPDSSWLRYHIKYCITENKYFVYPYISLTTNCSDIGTNYRKTDNSTQVPVLCGKNKCYYFSTFDKNAIRYDGFWERENLEEILSLPTGMLSVDLYGFRIENKSKYLLTLEHKQYKIVRSFSLRYRPHEMNIIENQEGNEIFLYDLDKPEKQIFHNDPITIKWIYDFRKPGTLKKAWWRLIINFIKNKWR